MSREEKNKRFIKRGKIFVFVMGLLCLMNIIILIGKNSSYALFRRTVSSKRIIEIHTAKEFPKAEKPTSSMCKSNLSYTGSLQELVTDPNPKGYTYSNYEQKDAGTYEVTATLDKGYRWTDNTKDEVKFNCTIKQVTTTLRYSPTSLTVEKGKSKTVTITASTTGSWNIRSNSTSKATVDYASGSSSSKNVTVGGVASGSTTLSVTFTPTDTTNYTIATGTYNVTVTSPPAVTQLKEKLGTGGLIAVTTSNTKTTDKSASNIREYRYSGATANNYVTFNDEKWRIIGIFKDESGNEHMKIVRNEKLPASAMPDTYTVSGTSYKIRYSSSSATAYWNYTGSAYNNNWVKGGLKYWLNSEGTTNGYLKSLTSTAQNMIYEAKWYLGNVVITGGTAVTDYTNERGSKSCSGSCSGGGIWSGNSATWTGKIGLMYPSDMGFSTDSSYWNTNMSNFSSTHLNTTWLKEGHTSEWFLSPSASYSYSVALWQSSGDVVGGYANIGRGVRPVLYLKSDTTINGGEGTSTTPYTLTS